MARRCEREQRRKAGGGGCGQCCTYSPLVPSVTVWASLGLHACASQDLVSARRLS